MVNNKPRVLVIGSDQMVEQTNCDDKPSPEMDAIAVGVEAKLDPFRGYSKTVTQRTLEIARQLGIAKEERQRWARARVKLDSKRDRVIKSESI